MSRIIITDKNGNKQVVDLPEEFEIEVDLGAFSYKTTTAIPKGILVRRLQDFISTTNHFKENKVFGQFNDTKKPWPTVTEMETKAKIEKEHYKQDLLDAND